jgi:hypothetical protein
MFVVTMRPEAFEKVRRKQRAASTCVVHALATPSRFCHTARWGHPRGRVLEGLGEKQADLPKIERGLVVGRGMVSATTSPARQVSMNEVKWRKTMYMT